MMRDKQRPFINKGEDILPFEKMKEQRMRERMARLERVRRAIELRRYCAIAHSSYTFSRCKIIYFLTIVDLLSESSKTKCVFCF